MEPLTILGGVAASAQLTKYSLSLFRSAAKLPGQLRSAPEAIKSLMEDVEGYLATLRSFSLESQNSEDSLALQAKIDRCTYSATQLQGMLKQMVFQDNDTRSIRLKKAIAFRRKTRTIGKRLADIERGRGILSFHIFKLLFQGSGAMTTPQNNSSAILVQNKTLNGKDFDVPPRSKVIGRDSTISLVTEALANPTLGHKACLLGIRGIGKSTTALEYAYMMQEQNPNISIFWVIGTNHIAFQESITRLGRHLGLSSSHGSGFTDFRGVADWLGSDAAGPWILVIDDIDLDTFDYWQVLQGALPRTFSGSILFTTQNKKVAYALVEPHQESVVSMEKRSPDEVRQLLLLQLGPTTLCQGHSDSIIDHIGYVTSDTAQAAAYTTSTPILPTTCTHNLTQSEACGTNLLNEANTGNTSLQVCAMCGGSLLASFDAVCMHNSAAAEILAIIACIAPQRMSRDLFVYVGNHFQLEEGLRLLKSQSIIVTDDADENFSMCSLVHRSFQQQLKRKSGFSLHAYSVLRFLSDFFPATTEQYHRLPECRNYLPHAISVWNTVFGDNDGRPYPYLNLASASQLASQISLYLRIIGKYQEAKIFALRAYECVSRGLGPVSPQALICQANIGTIEQCLGDTKLFSKRIDTTLRAGASVVRAHDPEAIPLLRKKGLALQAEGRHAEAEGYHRQAIYLSERVHGADDIKTLNEQHGLALSLIGQRQLSEALILLEHIRDCMSMSLNSDNPRIYSILFNIGGVLQLQSHWEEAGQVIAQALAGRERVLGESHPQTLHCKANMALIYISKGNSTKAEELTREVLAAHETQLGLDHPLSLHMQNNLGYILLDQKRYSEAEEVLNQVVNGRARKLGAEHGETLASMFYLAEALENLGKYAQAFEVAETILAVRQRTLKESDVDRVVSEAQVERLECAFREWLSARTLVGSIADAEMGDSDMSSNSSVGVSTPETISSATFSDTVVDVDSGLLT